MESCMIKKAVILEFQKLPLLAENVYRILIYFYKVIFHVGLFLLTKISNRFLG